MTGSPRKAQRQDEKKKNHSMNAFLILPAPKELILPTSRRRVDPCYFLRASRFFAFSTNENCLLCFVFLATMDPSLGSELS